MDVDVGRLSADLIGAPIAKIMPLQRVRETQHRRLVRRESNAKVPPTNLRNAGDSYSACSAPGSDRLKHCCAK